MKEQTYGWYPSAKDVYKDRRMGAPNAYQLDAMYKFRDSKYYTAPSPPSHKPHIYRPTPTPPLKRPVSSNASRFDVTDGLQVCGKGYSERDQESPSYRAKSAPVVFNYQRPPRLNIPTPTQCWATKVPETPITSPVAQPPSQSTNLSMPNVSPTVERKDPDIMTKRERIKSAVIRRDRPPIPPRPVKSAGPSRQGTAHQDTNVDRPSRPKNPTPFLQQELPDYEDVSSDVSSDDYYEALRAKYGWLAEVHGDPLKLKKPPKRYPYTVKVAEPQIAPNPPKAHMENLETFFLNTIPRRPMTYTIHKEWISEVIHAKRMELQKREGIPYRWKNFSFVY